MQGTEAKLAGIADETKLAGIEVVEHVGLWCPKLAHFQDLNSVTNCWQPEEKELWVPTFYGKTRRRGGAKGGEDPPTLPPCKLGSSGTSQVDLREKAHGLSWAKRSNHFDQIREASRLIGKVSGVGSCLRFPNFLWLRWWSKLGWVI